MLVAVGAVLLILGVALLIPGIVTIARTMPFGVVGADGAPGSDVIAVADVPGDLALEMAAGDSVTFWSVSSYADGTPPRWEVDVHGADGTPLRTQTGVSSTTGRGGTRAASIGDFTAPHSGAFDVSVRAAPGSSESARMFVTEAVGVPAFATSLVTGIGLIVAAAGAVAVGLMLGVGGGIWWVVVAQSTRPHGAASTYSPPPATR